MANLFIRKEFKTTQGNYIDIYEYLYHGGSDTDVLPKFTHEEKDFIFSIEMHPAGEGYIDLMCYLYKKDNEEPLYKTSYTIFAYECLYNVFMIDTKYKQVNELNKDVDEDVEFYFTFSDYNDEGLDENQLDIHVSKTIFNPLGKPISNLFGLIKYNSFKENELYRLLFNFISDLNEFDDFINDPIDKEYFLSQLEYLKDKLSLAGYDEDYFNENKDNLKSTDDMNNDEKLNYLVVVTLDYLYNKSTDLMVDYCDLHLFNKSYYDNLSKAI